jgi:excisionase family DNA binding protein
MGRLESPARRPIRIPPREVPRVSTPILVRPDEAAAYTRRPVHTVYRWAHEGRLTRHGTGRGRVRYDLRELPAPGQPPPPRKPPP